jgi:hypothetical protein
MAAVRGVMVVSHGPRKPSDALLVFAASAKGGSGKGEGGQ